MSNCIRLCINASWNRAKSPSGIPSLLSSLSPPTPPLPSLLSLFLVLTNLDGGEECGGRHPPPLSSFARKTGRWEEGGGHKKMLKGGFIEGEEHFYNILCLQKKNLEAMRNENVKQTDFSFLKLLNLIFAT